jgi:hypothetical protein
MSGNLGDTVVDSYNILVSQLFHSAFIYVPSLFKMADVQGVNRDLTILGRQRDGNVRLPIQ